MDVEASPTLPLGPLGIGEMVAARYRVEALLGEGGMGAVYRARDLELDEDVALKVLRGELAATPDGLARFRREDVFALGVMLFELLAGRLPFTGETPVAIAVARVLGAAPRLAEIAPAAPPRVCELVDLALSRRREERPDATVLAARIDELRGVASPRQSLARLRDQERFLEARATVAGRTADLFG